jgi:hypothetical protein
VVGQDDKERNLYEFDKNVSLQIKIPNTTKYIYVLHSMLSTGNRLPSKLEINGYDYCKGVTENISEVFVSVRDNAANALKKKVEGTVLELDDISPLKHQVKCELSSKTLSQIEDGERLICTGKNLIKELTPHESLNEGKPATVYVKILAHLPIGTYTLTSTKDIYWQKQSDGIGSIKRNSFQKYTFEVIKQGDHFINVRDNTSSDTPWSNQILLQIEMGEEGTSYERPCVIEYPIHKINETIMASSISPLMRIYSTNNALEIKAQYNVDINKAYDELQSNYEKLKTAIEKLGGTIE